MEKYDLVIAGAGLAGLSLARELKDSGLRILALEKRLKKQSINYYSSGTFMKPEEFGLPLHLFHKLKEIRYCSRNNEAIRDIQAAYVIDRVKLYEYLENEACKNPGFAVAYGAEVINSLTDNKGHITGLAYTHEGRTCNAKGAIFADCTGLAAKLGAACGIINEKPVLAAGLEYIHKIKGGGGTAHLFVGSNIAGCYGWIFPKGKGLAITGLGTVERKQYGKLSQLFDEMRAHWKLSAVFDGKPVEKHVAALRTGKPARKFILNNLIVLGDSALQANPLIGEGIRFILFAARCAAVAIGKVKAAGSLKPLKQYEKAWNDKYRSKFKTAYLMQRVLKRATKHDWILDKGVQLLKVISENDFRRIISADISIMFFIRIFFEAVWKIKILNQKF
jgi:digeranylgeranylglycerophospholipid reductase